MAKLPRARRDALLALTALLAPEDAPAMARVALALEDPAAYVKAFRGELKERGLKGPVDDLPWIALVDALLASKRLVELDWEAAPEELVFGLSKLRTAPRAKAWQRALRDDPEREERLAWELLELFGRALKPEGVVPCQLDMDSDAYPVLLLPPAQVPRAKALAKKAGFGDFDAFTGTELAKARKARVAWLAAKKTKGP